jgi:hypothetical protein
MFRRRYGRQGGPAGEEPSYAELGARVEHILRLAEDEAAKIRAEASRATPPVPADAGRFYVLLATEGGRTGLVSAQMYVDPQQARDALTEYRAGAGTEGNVRYSIGAVTPLGRP